MTIKSKIAALLGLSSLPVAAQAAQQSASNEHAVIVYFQYGSQDLSRLHEMEKRIESAIVSVGAGEYDGHEIAVDGSDGVLYMYGLDADGLFEAVRPILEATGFMRGAEVVNRYGPPGPASKTNTVLIGG